MSHQYKAILIDPPWPIRQMGSCLVSRGVRQVEQVYPTMTIQDIKKLPVCDLADDGAHVWLWAVNQLLPEAFEVM